MKRTILITIISFMGSIASAQYVESFNDREVRRIFASTGTDSIVEVEKGRFILYYGKVAVNLYNDLGGDLMLAWGMEGGCSDALIHRWNEVRFSKSYIDSEGDVVLSSHLRSGCITADDVLEWQRTFVSDQKLFVDLVLEDRSLDQSEE